MITSVKIFLTNGCGEDTGKGEVSETELNWCYPAGWDSELFGAGTGVYYVELEDGRRGRLVVWEFCHDEVEEEDKNGEDPAFWEPSAKVARDILNAFSSWQEAYGGEPYIELYGGPFGRHLGGVFITPGAEKKNLASEKKVYKVWLTIEQIVGDDVFEPIGDPEEAAAFASYADAKAFQESLLGFIATVREKTPPRLSPSGICEMRSDH